MNAIEVYIGCAAAKEIILRPGEETESFEELVKVLFEKHCQCESNTLSVQLLDHVTEDSLKLGRPCMTNKMLFERPSVRFKRL